MVSHKTDSFLIPFSPSPINTHEFCSNYVPAKVQIPPLPPYLLRQSNRNSGPRRRLLDIIPPPPALLPTTVAPIPRPCTLSATSDGETKSGIRRRPFALRIKSQSLDVLYQPDEAVAVEAKGEESNETEGEDEEGEETGGVAPVNPVPLALWSALHVASVAPLFLDCHPTVPVRPYPSTAPQSASFARVTFSPFTADEFNVSVLCVLLFYFKQSFYSKTLPLLACSWCGGKSPVLSGSNILHSSSDHSFR